MKHPPPGAQPVRYRLLDLSASASPPHVTPTDGFVIDETWLSIYVNGQELAALMCSPVQRAALVLGFLFNEEIIDARAEVGLLRLNAAGTVADVFLRRAEVGPPRRVILTSGCGGVTLADRISARPALTSAFATTPAQVLARMDDLQGAAALYRAVRGVHSAALATPAALLLSAEDIGRHNTVDKLAGLALERELDLGGALLLTSGRISSEMLAKARRMGVPLVASRTAPTSAAVAAAQAWGICIVGYVRGQQMRVYTHPARLSLPE